MNVIIKLFSAILLLGITSTPSIAQETQEVKKKIHTVEFKVQGVCKMCKKRIERAALIKGVKMAEWNKVDQTIKVVYKTKNVTEEDVHNAIAKAGHDTDLAKAPDEKYSKLPKCCRYRDGIKVH